MRARLGRRRDETRRLERVEEEERMKRRLTREKLRAVEVRESHGIRWKALLAPSSGASTDSPPGLADIPCPIYLACAGKGHAPSSL